MAGNIFREWSVASSHKIYVGPALLMLLSWPSYVDYRFPVSFKTQSIRKSHRIAEFQINWRRENLVCLIIEPCVLNLRRGWWAIDFQVPERCLFVFFTNRAQSFYVATVFSHFGSSIFFTHFTSILRKVSRLSYNSYLQGKSYFGFLLFLSSVIRLEYQT